MENIDKELHQDPMQIPNRKLAKSEILNAVVENSTVAFLLFDNQHLFYANQQAKKLLNVDSTSSPHAADVLPTELFASLKAIAEHNHDSEVQVNEIELRFASGESRWMESTLSNLNLEGKVLQQLSLKDISNSKRRESELLREATTDDLSGLGNRRQFRRVLDGHANESLAIAMVDVDHFKGINDSFGHFVGDNAIRFVAGQLLSHFSDKLCVARLGGEEFAVVSTFDSPNEIAEQFENFRISIGESQFSAHTIKLTVSIGLAFSNQDIEISELLARADKALYQSKNAGRNRLTVYSD